jgi:hypothetical protein
MSRFFCQFQRLARALEEYEVFLEKRRTLVSDALNSFLSKLRGESELASA